MRSCDGSAQSTPLNRYVAILIYLLFVNERFHNPKSFWKPYFGARSDLRLRSRVLLRPYAGTKLDEPDALPDEYTLPLFWSEKTLTLLNGTPMRCAFRAVVSCTQPRSRNFESAARAASQL